MTASTTDSRTILKRYNYSMQYLSIMYLAAEFVSLLHEQELHLNFELTAIAIYLICRRKRGAVTRMCRKNRDNLRESPIPLCVLSMELLYASWLRPPRHNEGQTDELLYASWLRPPRHNYLHLVLHVHTPRLHH